MYYLQKYKPIIPSTITHLNQRSYFITVKPHTQCSLNVFSNMSPLQRYSLMLSIFSANIQLCHQGKNQQLRDFSYLYLWFLRDNGCRIELRRWKKTTKKSQSWLPHSLPQPPRT